MADKPMKMVDGETVPLSAEEIAARSSVTEAQQAALRARISEHKAARSPSK